MTSFVTSAERVAHYQRLAADAMSKALHEFGGYLRCETCGARRELGDIGAKLAHGWPRCHEQTMRWWTARQVEAGEDQPDPAFRDLILAILDGPTP